MIFEETKSLYDNIERIDPANITFNKFLLPKILANDPLAKEMNLHEGDVISVGKESSREYYVIININNF